jgi:hypothetical protein
VRDAARTHLEVRHPATGSWRTGHHSHQEGHQPHLASSQRYSGRECVWNNSGQGDPATRGRLTERTAVGFDSLAAHKMSCLSRNSSRLEVISRVPLDKAAARIGEACSDGWNGFAVEYLRGRPPCRWLRAGRQGPGRLSCRTACPQLFTAEDDHGLPKHRWCDLAYGLGSRGAANKEKPFRPNTVQHQSLQTLSEATEGALHGGAGDMSGRRISLGQPLHDAAGTQLRQVGSLVEIWQQD